MEFTKSVIVAGAGKSGIGAAELLLKTGADVILYDSNADQSPDMIREKISDKPSLRIVLGELTDEIMDSAEVCVISPGISMDAEFVKKMQSRGLPIWSEIELAYRFAKGKLAAITGTNGKTTTTALTGEIVKAWNEKTFVVGNIGVAYTSQALKTTEESVTVAEVSSFQLETIRQFKPDVSAILNITPDHLNRHKTMEEYIRVKESIAANQSENGTCVLNYEDEVLREFGGALKARVRYFSSARELNEGAFLRDGEIICREDGEEIRVCPVSELQIIGRHNYENAMAAVLIARALSVPFEIITPALKQFAPVEHRIEFVTEKNGVRYYNDSKGTNPDAAIQGIKAMTRPTVLIAGGYDKQSEYDEWILSFNGNVKQMILLGQTADKIEAAAARLGFENCVRASSMEEAVTLASRAAVPGDAVLLSPACASWGMFPNYEERGRIFKECVKAL